MTLLICSECKNICDKDGEWQEMEVYFRTHAKTQFSHSYCPECGKRALEEVGLTGGAGSNGVEE